MSSTNGIIFRTAALAETALLTELCRVAKAYWGYPPEWMEAWRDELKIAPSHIGVGWVGVVEVGGIIAGFYGLKNENDSWHLEHLWLRPEWIGRGLGRALFGEAVRAARGRGAKELLIKSDPNAEAFYLKMGATRTRVESYFLFGLMKRELPHLRFALY